MNGINPVLETTAIVYYSSACFAWWNDENLFLQFLCGPRLIIKTQAKPVLKLLMRLLKAECVLGINIWLIIKSFVL